MPDARKAKGIQREEPHVGQPLDDFRLSLESELSASLERSLRLHKAETIAAELDRKRSTVYRWVASPGDVPLACILVLARFDPDPEFLARVAGHLLASLSQQALARQVAGRVALVLTEIAPGKWGRQ